MKIAIYTTIFGGYDQLKPQPAFPGVDYFCFSDSLEAKDPLWRVIRTPKSAEHPRISAKRFKAMPESFIDPRYDLTIYIDGSIRIVGADFIERCKRGLASSGIACMRHPHGTCIYQEAQGCLHFPKYQQERIEEQVRYYRTKGYPEQNGLAACGIIVRDHRSPTVKTLGEDWFEENLNWTYQDQISFPYVIWRNKASYDILPIDYYDRNTFVLVDHTHEG